MILWPSSGCCRPKQSETILNVLKSKTKRSYFFGTSKWTDAEQIEKPRKNPKSTGNDERDFVVGFISRPPSPPPVIQPANESPMYIITNNQGHRFLNANECHIVRHPHPSPERKGKCEHDATSDFSRCCWTGWSRRRFSTPFCVGMLGIA
jgi:hypothetical protein